MVLAEQSSLLSSAISARACLMRGYWERSSALMTSTLDNSRVQSMPCPVKAFTCSCRRLSSYLRAVKSFTRASISFSRPRRHSGSSFLSSSSWTATGIRSSTFYRKDSSTGGKR